MEFCCSNSAGNIKLSIVRTRHDRYTGRTEHYTVDIHSYGFPFYPEGEGRPTLGGSLLREKRHLSRTEVCVDRAGSIDDLSEVSLSLPLPPALSDASESHKSGGQFGPLRHVHADDQHGLICTLELFKQHAHIGDSDMITLHFPSDVCNSSKYLNAYVVTANGGDGRWTMRPTA
jgi:hypothetical protein